MKNILIIYLNAHTHTHTHTTPIAHCNSLKFLNASYYELCMYGVCVCVCVCVCGGYVWYVCVCMHAIIQVVYVCKWGV